MAPAHLHMPRVAVYAALLTFTLGIIIRAERKKERREVFLLSFSALVSNICVFIFNLYFLCIFFQMYQSALRLISIQIKILS